MTSKEKSIMDLNEVNRKNAKHGEFFFAEVFVNGGFKRPSPVFIISNDFDKEDIIICSCTSQPAKTEYDILVNLKKPTCVRTNKIYTIHREQLQFKISQIVSQEEYKLIIEKLKKSLNLND